MPRQHLPPQIKKITLKNGKVPATTSRRTAASTRSPNGAPNSTSDSTPRRKRATPCATSSTGQLGAPT